MSKSKGNVINPMELVAEYGSDALRLGLIASRSPGQNQAFTPDRVIAGRNFCNKLWNISRFIQNSLGDTYTPEAPSAISLADHWIVKELTKAKEKIEKALDSYRFAEANEALYHAIWDSVADWYVEASKEERNPDLLAWVLETSLKLAHPFAPFVTETIWQTLPWRSNLLITEHWPEMPEYSDIAAGQFKQVQKTVTEARFVASSLPGNDRYTLLYVQDTLLDEAGESVRRLAGLQAVTKTDQPRGLRLALADRDAWLDVPAKVLEEHQHNLEVRLAQTHKEIQNLEARLSNESYVAKAPAALVEETQRQREEKQALVVRLQEELKLLS
jgi:valyl-tRNA synthetase